MKKLGYFLAACSFVWVVMIGGADFEGSFLKNALIILAGAAIGIVGFLSSVWLVYTAKQREKEDYRLLIEGGKSCFLRGRRRIPALKKR